jgi:hypothetical protein
VRSNRTAAHKTPTCPARHDDSIRDLLRRAGRPAWRIAVATRQALDPVCLSLAELLHVVELTFLQEINGCARVLQDVEGGDVGVLAAQETTVVAAMSAQTRGQGRLCAAHIHKLAGWRRNAVEAPKEGLRGGRVLIRGRSGHCETRRRAGSFLLSTGAT